VRQRGTRSGSHNGVKRHLFSSGPARLQLQFPRHQGLRYSRTNYRQSGLKKAGCQKHGGAYLPISSASLVMRSCSIRPATGASFAFPAVIGQAACSPSKKDVLLQTYELDSRLLRACASFRHGRLPGDGLPWHPGPAHGPAGIAAVRVKRQLGSAPARAKEQHARGAGEAAQVHELGKYVTSRASTPATPKFGRKSFLRAA